MQISNVDGGVEGAEHSVVYPDNDGTSQHNHRPNSQLVYSRVFVFDPLKLLIQQI